MISVLLLSLLSGSPNLIRDERLIRLESCYLAHRQPTMNGAFQAEFKTQEDRVIIFGGTKTNPLGLSYQSRLTSSGVTEDYTYFVFLDLHEKRVLHASYSRRDLIRKRVIRNEFREYWSDGTREAERDWFARRLSEILGIVIKACGA